MLGLRLPAWTFLGLLAPGACTTSAPPPVDLAATRAAVGEAAAAARSEESRAAARRARERLDEAERLAASPEALERRRAGDVADIALVEARSSRLLDRASAPAVPAPGPAPSPDPDTDRLKARLRKAAEDQRRLEERLAVLQRDLEATETEVIRTKARLKGIETKAEASSVIAEAHTLLLRLQDDKVRGADVSRAREKLDRAERQLREKNYGAAVFFALQAQELLGQATRSRAATPKASAGGKPAPE